MSPLLLRAPRSVVLASALLVATLALGCSSTPPRRADAPPAPPAAASAEPEEPALPPGSLSRSRVDAVLRRGPPWLLGRVEVEEVLRKGAFVGWRVVSMPAGWERGGLRTGDVVTRVNGLGLEKPDDFFAVWTAVASAKEIRVEVERDGKPEAIALAIVGEPSPDTKEDLEREVPPPSASPLPPPGPGSPRHRTVIIGGSGEDAF